MKGDLLVFNPGQIIFLEGDDSKGVYFVKEGKIEVFRSRDGIEINLAYLIPGDVLGTLTVLNREARTASARASTQCSLVFVSVESLDTALKGIPLWATAILKDAIIRLKGVDDRLCEARLFERKLVNRVGTQFHHAAQLAALLSMQIVMATIEDEALVLCPLQGFIERAESILLQRAEYLQEIYGIFIKSGLVKEIKNQKYGMVLEHPNPEFIQDFSVFCRNVAKDGKKGFIPIKYVPIMASMLRLNKKYQKEWWLRSELAQSIAKDLNKHDIDSVLLEFLSKGVLRAKPGSENKEVQFSPVLVQKKIVYESCCRLLEDIVCDVASEVA